jgi:hypothetical protein
MSGEIADFTICPQAMQLFFWMKCLEAACGYAFVPTSEFREDF